MCIGCKKEPETVEEETFSPIGELETEISVTVKPEIADEDVIVPDDIKEAAANAFGVQEYNVNLYAVADNVGAHSEPNSTSETVYKFIQNEKACVTGLTENGWYQVLYDVDKVGYVYPNMLTEKPVEIPEAAPEEELKEETVQAEPTESKTETKDEPTVVAQTEPVTVVEVKPVNKTPGELWEEDWVNNVINKVYDPDRYSDLFGYGQSGVLKISYFEAYVYEPDEAVRQYAKEQLFSDAVWSTCTESEKQQLNAYFSNH